MGPFPQISQTFGIFSLSILMKKEFIPYFEKKSQTIIIGSKHLFSVMRETSNLIEKCGDGSSPSEAHCGGWEGLGKDGGEPALWQITRS